MTPDQIQKIKEYIKDGDLDKAIKRTLFHCKENNDLITLSCNYNTWKKNSLSGLDNTSNTKFIQRLLLFLDQQAEEKNKAALIQNRRNVNIKDYLKKTFEKHRYINDFLYRSHKVDFLKIYYPLKAKYADFITEFKDLQEIFDEYKYISIIGTAGSGKTVLLNFILLKSIESEFRIPFLLRFRNINIDDNNFEAYVFQTIQKGLRIGSEPEIVKLLEKGDFIFLLDGFDEFSGNIQELYAQIERFIDTYSANYFVVASRPDSGIEISTFSRFDILDLSYNDIKNYIQRQEVDGLEKIVQYIEKAEKNLFLFTDEHRVNYLKKPLFLSLFLLIFDILKKIPEDKSTFYQKVFDVLITDGNEVLKNKFKKGYLSKIDKDEIEETLAHFCMYALLDKKYSFNEIDIKKYLDYISKEITSFKFKNQDFKKILKDSSILVYDEMEYSFFHRSFQDYFAIQHLGKLSLDQRENVYKKLNSEKSFKSFNSIHDLIHLYSLIHEMDQIGFNKIYLLPVLQRIRIPSPNFSSEEELVNSYFNLVRGYQFGYDLDEYTKTIKYMVEPLFPFSSNFYILLFSKMLPPDDIVDEVYLNMLKELIDKEQGRNWSYDLSKWWKEEELKPIVLKALSTDKIRNYFIKVNKKIAEIESIDIQ